MHIRTAGLGKALTSRRGSVAIQLGILMSVLIGMAALGSEIPFVIYKHRQMQNAADAAALGGALALAKGYPPIATEADGIAAALGFTNGVNGVTVTVNNPPKSGNYTTNSSAVEVIVSQPQTLKMAGLFVNSPFNVSARAVALGGSGGGNYCILATDTGSDQAVTFSGGSTVALTGCGLAVNATGSQALTVSGGATLVTQSVSVSGEIVNGGTITAANGVKVNQPAVADPYASVPLPASSGCDYTNFTLNNGSGTQQMSPGRYCNGVSIQGGATVAMAPGIYYIKSGTFSVQGVLTGSGVTIVLTQNTNGYATVQVGGGNTQITLSAPASGSTAGLIFFADRNAPNNGQDQFSGTLSFTGALYFPTQQVKFPGGTSVTGCMQLIGWQITVSGGAQFTSNCNTGGNLLVE